MSGPRRLVIVGSGMAAARLAEQVLARRGSQSFDVVMFGDEPGGTYNRILLSGVLAGRHAGPDIVTNSLEWYGRHGITLHAGVRVADIDLQQRQVVDGLGGRHRFDTLVLATGSQPFVPPIDGLVTSDGGLRTGAFVFRTVDDCARIATAAAAARRAVVLGGGLLGLEAARGLAGYGIQVTIVHRGRHLMDAQLDAQAGRILQREFEATGIGVLTGATTARVIGDTALEALALDDGSRMECDLLVIAAGVRPNTALARRAGLPVGHGVIVGDDLACHGIEGVHAVGDCAEHDGQVYGLVAPAWEQVDVLADRLTGRRPDATYRGSRIATKLKVAGLEVAVMGERDACADDDVITYAEPSRGIYNRVIVRRDRIAGAILMGAATATSSIVQRFLDAASVPTRRSELLFPPVGDAPVASDDESPDSARVCDCNAVAKDAIVEAVLNGARSLRAVCEVTRAGTGCGSCRPEVQRILDVVCREVGDGVSPAVSENHASA